MNLHRLLKQREADKKPLRVALLGAGKFGSMFMSQAARTPGLRLVAVADLSPGRARAALTRVGWPAAALNAESTADALKNGKVYFTDDTDAVIASPDVEIVVDATGQAAAGIEHVLACCEHGKHIIMVNVEADALAGRCWRAARGRHRLFAGLRRPARADLRNGRLGARLRLRGHGRRQAPSTCRNSILPRPTRSGRTTASPQRWWPPATSMRRCSTASWMAPRAPSRWPPCPTRRACSPRRPACTSRPAAWTTWRACCGARGRRHPASSRTGGSGVLAGARRPPRVP